MYFYGLGLEEFISKWAEEIEFSILVIEKTIKKDEIVPGPNNLSMLSNVYINRIRMPILRNVKGTNSFSGELRV